MLRAYWDFFIINSILFFFILIFFSIFFFASITFFIVVFFVITFCLRAVALYFFWFNLCVVSGNKTFHDLRCSVSFGSILFYKSRKGVSLWVLLWRKIGSQPVGFGQRHCTWEFVPADELSLVVSHVQRREECAKKVAELRVTFMEEVFFDLAVLSKVIERNGVALDTNLFD